MTWKLVDCNTGILLVICRSQDFLELIPVQLPFQKGLLEISDYFVGLDLALRVQLFACQIDKCQPADHRDEWEQDKRQSLENLDCVHKNKLFRVESGFRDPLVSNSV